MTLQLTPESLAACYNYLLQFDPFVQWNLPDSEDIVFRVVKSRKIWGQVKHTSPPIVEISSAHIGRHESLLATMSHEIIHLHQNATEILGRNAHDAAFCKFADAVCKVHNFDRKQF